MKDIIKTLNKIAASESVSRIDASSNISVHIVRQLFEKGLVDAIDMSDLEGDCFGDVRININGRDWLKNQILTNHIDVPWWKSFDRRITVLGVIISIIGLYLGLK